MVDDPPVSLTTLRIPPESVFDGRPDEEADDKSRGENEAASHVALPR
jgi:hypothetical protein